MSYNSEDRADVIANPLKSIGDSLARFIIACGVVAATLTGAEAFSRYSWLCELASHFRVQYFVALIIAAAVAILIRKRRTGFVFVVFALINLSAFLPLYFGREPLPTGGKPFRVVMMNVLSSNRRADLVTDFIRQADPDVIVMGEVTGRWMSQTQSLAQTYPYVEACPREDNFGIALFSKRPFIRSGIAQVGDAGVPSVYAELEVDGRPVFFMGTHPISPASPGNSRYRDTQLGEIPAFLKKATSSPIVLLGDLNVTPWYRAFRTLVRESGLKDTAKGRGVQCSWPAFPHMFHMRIPLDHCLVSPEIGVVDRRLGPGIGSDHFPLIVDLAVPGVVCSD
jgi:endonuclease/exonuclease/phosphatase (EEP) superfamily protein YafD